MQILTDDSFTGVWVLGIADREDELPDLLEGMMSTLEDMGMIGGGVPDEHYGGVKEKQGVVRKFRVIQDQTKGMLPIFANPFYEDDAEEPVLVQIKGRSYKEGQVWVVVCMEGDIE